MITLALQAMATRFELVLPGESPNVRAAGEEALQEIRRVEGLLNLYDSSSEVASLNRRAGMEPVRVSHELFALIQRAMELSCETAGAFDITIAPLVRCWGFMKGSGELPAPAEIEAARAHVGSHLLELDALNRTVRFTSPGMMLDFGAFGKGYSVDCAVEILRGAAVSSALLHGGTSTVYGLGAQPDGQPWKIAIEGDPTKGRNRREEILNNFGAATAQERSESPPIDSDAEPVLAVVELRDESLSVSASWGKSFSAQGRTFGHVLDTRTGQPCQRAELAAVILPSAAESDALSTALLVEGPAGIDSIGARRENAQLLVLAGEKTFARIRPPSSTGSRV